MKLLSLKELSIFDYTKTRERVDDYLKDLTMIKFKYRNVLPPSLASNLFDIRIIKSGVPKSQIEIYTEKKDEFERLYYQKLKEIDILIDDMTIYEKRFFKDHFINGIPMKFFENEFHCGRELVCHIKKSSVIKFALALDLAVYK